MKHGDEFFSSLSFFFSFFSRDSEFFFWSVRGGICEFELQTEEYHFVTTQKEKKKVLFSCERDYTLRTFNGLK